MSGPKTSHYSLTPEQRRQLMEQLRKEQEEQLRREKLKTAKKRLSNLQNKITQFINEVIEISNNEQEILEKVQNLAKAIDTSRTSLNSEVLSNVNESYYKLLKYNDEMRVFLTAYFKKQAEEKQRENELIDNMIANGFTLILKKIKNKEELNKNIYYKKIQEELESLVGMQLSADLLNELNRIKRIAIEIENIDFIENFFSITVCPFISRCKEYYEQYKQYSEEYYELCAEYRMLMEARGEKPEDFEEFSMENLEKLSLLVKEYNDVSIKELEEEYISKSIDDAMREMGYKLVGNREVIKRSGKKTHKDLYHFCDGTVVDITYSDNGQISMELGAVDDVDRMPTEEEAQKLKEDMSKFCNEYVNLEEHLMKKGIVRKNIQMLPPSVAYAQVINVSEYDMIHSVEKYRIDKKQRSIHEKKHMNI